MSEITSTACSRSQPSLHMQARRRATAHAKRAGFRSSSAIWPASNSRVTYAARAAHDSISTACGSPEEFQVGRGSKQMASMHLLFTQPHHHPRLPPEDLMIRNAAHARARSTRTPCASRVPEPAPQKRPCSPHEREGALQLHAVLLAGASRSRLGVSSCSQNMRHK